MINSTGTETRQFSSHMPIKGKFLKSFFISTLNGTAVSVRYVSSTPVVLDARLND